MAIHGYFFNAVKDGDVYDRVYNAEDVTGYLDKIVGSGVFPNPSTQLQVSAGTGMQVVVAEGQGWINGHKIVNDSDLPLSISASDVLLTRIDSVIFFVDLTTREMGIEIKEGTPSTTPVAPALVRTSSRYEMQLATVRVAKQVEAITQQMITDTRANSDVCGFVAGLIQQVDTSTLFLQYQTAYAQMAAQMEAWQTAQQATFESWLATLTEKLQVGAYIKKFEKSAPFPTDPATSGIVLDMDGYQYEEADVILVFINGLSASEGSDFTISYSSGTGLATIILPNLTAGDPDNVVSIKVFKAVLGTPIQGGSAWTQPAIRNIISAQSIFSQEEEE